MIQIKNLTKVYETVNYNIIALSDVNYTLDQGEVLVLLGKSGSGKSTLLNIIGGFDRNYAGHYIFDGESMKAKSEREIDTIRKRRIGFVFQQYVLLNNLTVIENVELALQVIGVVNSGSRKRAALHALKLVGLRDHAKKYPYELSGGQRQRVAIARAFVKNPDVIIADEPTAALDSRTSKEILDLLVDLCRTKLLIIATHNKSIVRDYASRVIELKSGYTIKDELITDRSKVHVDELDLIIDQELKEENEAIEKMIDIEEHIKGENKATVLKDLGVDLKQFRLNKQDEFLIDEEVKKKLIKQRMKNTSLKTRIYRFLQTSDDFHGKKRYANKSFFRNLGLHLFSALIFTVFLLTIVFGFNFITETFGGFNEKAMFTRTMNNENMLFFTSSTIEMEEQDQAMYTDLKTPFIRDFSQTNILEAKFLDELFLDPYVRYRYEQEKILYIKEQLALEGKEDALQVYYNNSSIVLQQENPEIVFESLRYTYQNIVEYPQPYVSVTNFMNVGLNEDLVYQFDAIYSDANEDIILQHLLEGSRLPESDNEIVIPVGYLFDFDILQSSDFLDEYGNVLEIIPSEQIEEAFNNLEDEDKIVELSKNIITFEDAGNSYTESYDEITTQFEIVGLVNFDGDINPFLDVRNDVFVPNNAPRTFSFIVSSTAKDSISFEIVDNATYGNFSKAIQYATISKENYELYQVEDMVNTFDTEFKTSIKEEVKNQFMIWITALRDGSERIETYIQADLAGENPDGTFFSTEVDNELFPGLTHQDLLDYYIAQHLSVIGNETEFRYLCSGCNMIARSFDSVYPEAQDAYDRAKASLEYVDVLEVYGDTERLTYQESTNRIIYEYYGEYFNNQFYESKNENTYSLELMSSYEQEYGSILSLIYVVVPRVLLDSIPFLNSFITMIQNLESNPSFISFMEQTNLDLLISSISTNAIRSVVMIVLYAVVYVLLFLSIIFLSIVLINLYGNIYETATRKRVKELASLRILGTSYDDIYDMVQLENRKVSLFSYASFIVIIFVLSRLNLFTDAPIRHFYMPLLGLFFDFNLYDVFVLNYVVIGFVTILFYIFIYKFIIKRVSTRKIKNIDTIRAIKDGDNL